ncbi:MAG TPA: CLC_0170 family protein [Clostridiaceae bacterium]
MIINLFTFYFLLLVLLESFVVGIIDAKTFRENNRKKAEKQAKFISLAGAFIAIMLFIINVFI